MGSLSARPKAAMKNIYLVCIDLGLAGNRKFVLDKRNSKLLNGMPLPLEN